MKDVVAELSSTKEGFFTLCMTGGAEIVLPAVEARSANAEIMSDYGITSFISGDLRDALRE
jgi:hypothetical protein